MERLAFAQEHLDGTLEEPDLLLGNLRDLARLNRLLGGTSLSRRAIEALLAATVPAEGHAELLDVGTGGADIPLALLADPRLGPRLRITATDTRSEVVAAARVLRPEIDRHDRLAIEVADGLALPYADSSFDVAHASLVLHHLDRPQAIALLTELRRVSRVGVVLNDLTRSRVAWLGAWLASRTLATSAWTRHDAPLSVRRAYRPDEARDLVEFAGLRPIAELRGSIGQRWAIAALRR